MPTAAKLMAAIAFGLAGLYLAYVTAPLFEDGKMPTYWFPLCAGAGVLCGWIIVGRRAGRGYSAGIGNGITGIVAVGFWALFIFSFIVMIRKSMRNSYDGPVEAVVNVFELLVDHGQDLASRESIVALFVSGIAAGVVTEFTARRLP